jgi:hypothetical protein
MTDDIKPTKDETQLEDPQVLDSRSSNSFRIGKESKQSGCCDPDERKALASERIWNAPNEVYLLFVAFLSDVNDTQQDVDLRGAYTSPSLAAHDARCWVITKQSQALGGTRDFCHDSSEYPVIHPGCHHFYSPAAVSKLAGGSFRAWTIRKVLH